MLINNSLSKVLLANSDKSHEEQLELFIDVIESEINEEISEKQRIVLVKKFHSFKSHLKTRWNQCSRVLIEFERKNANWLKLPFKIQFGAALIDENDKTCLKRGRHPMPFEEKGSNLSLNACF